MSNRDYTHIALIVDRSGSMQSIKSDAIGGMNAFVKEQQAQPGKCTMTFVQFDDVIEEVYSFVDIKDVELRTEENYQPRNWTALLDAIGMTITSTGQALKAMAEDDRPGVVILAILTDGHENKSKEFNHAQVREMIEHQSTVYKWVITYLGSTPDAINVAHSMGIPIAAAGVFAAGASEEAFRSHSNVVTRGRQASSRGQNFAPEDIGFMPEEREAMKGTTTGRLKSTPPGNNPSKP